MWLAYSRPPGTASAGTVDGLPRRGSLALMLVVELAFLIYAAWFWKQHGRLPSPFFYDPGDTFMDYFNTNFWAFREGRFEQWRSIYPLFVFQLGQWFTSPECTALSPFYLRSCDVASLFPLFVAYFVGILACEHLFSRRAGWGWRSHPLDRALLLGVLSLGMPGLFALERGNYIVFAFAFLALSVCFGKGWRAAFFLALALNVKQYLIVLLLVPFVKRRYFFLVQIALFCVAINLAAMLQVDDERHFGLLLENMTGFSASAEQGLARVWFPTSFSGWGEIIRYMVEEKGLLQHFEASLVQGAFEGGRLALATLCAVTLYLLVSLKERLDEDYMVFVVLLSALAFVDSLGGYALILLLPFWPAVLQRNPSSKIIWAVFVVLLVPAELPAFPQIMLERIKDVSGNLISFPLRFSLGAYLRPLAVLSLLVLTGRQLLALSSKSRMKS